MRFDDRMLAQESACSHASLVKTHPVEFLGFAATHDQHAVGGHAVNPVQQGGVLAVRVDVAGLDQAADQAAAGLVDRLGRTRQGRILRDPDDKACCRRCRRRLVSQTEIHFRALSLDTRIGSGSAGKTCREGSAKQGILLECCSKMGRAAPGWRVASPTAWRGLWHHGK